MNTCKETGGEALETALAVKEVKSSTTTSRTHRLSIVWTAISNGPTVFFTTCVSIATIFHTYPQIQPQLQPPHQRYQPRDRSTVQCFACGQYGHYRNECRDGHVRGNASGLAYINSNFGHGNQSGPLLGIMKMLKNDLIWFEFIYASMQM